MSTIEQLLNAVYEAMDGSEALHAYYLRHKIESAGVLTVTNDEQAALVAEYLRSRIEDKTVVEVGGGIGLLAFHMGMIARRVYCIEADPNWSQTFCAVLLHVKPKNVSYLFGAADEFAGLIKADVAVIATHSGLASMERAAALFAPEIIDIYGEIIRANPSAFDETARTLRALR